MRYYWVWWRLLENVDLRVMCENWSCVFCFIEHQSRHNNIMYENINIKRHVGNQKSIDYVYLHYIIIYNNIMLNST